MRKYAALGFLGMGLMISPLFEHFAGSTVPSAPRIGVVDVERLLAETPMGKRASDQFASVRKAKQVSIDKEQSDLKKDVDDYAKQKAVLKPDVQTQKEADLQKRAVELQAHAEKAEQELGTERQKVMQDVIGKTEPIIAAVAKAENVQLVEEKSAAVYVDPTLDLTAEVEAKMK